MMMAMATSRRDDMHGYLSGRGASTRATADALTRVDDAVALVLVEGISDQIAVETAAACQGRNLAAERVVVVPIGGAHAIGRFVTTLGPTHSLKRLAGLCDVREAALFRRGLEAARAGSTRTPTVPPMFVCIDDLEDELIRAVGAAGVEALFESQGDLGSFRSMQNQPAWRGRAIGAQMRRYLSSGSRRKLRYARLLVETAVGRDALPRPLGEVLGAV
jgi:hypothetical protein